LEDEKATCKEKSCTKYGHYCKLGYSKEECQKWIHEQKRATNTKTTTTGDKTIIITSGNMAKVMTSRDYN
jgi:hypothetical protein